MVTEMFDTLNGQILIEATDRGISKIHLPAPGRKGPLRRAAENPGPSGHPKAADHLDNAKKELSEFFNGTRKRFSFPLDVTGTSFQIKVWRALGEIPFGETRSYGEIASRIGSPRACRAVGAACRENPIVLVLPCHRVIGKTGALTGYAGGVRLKQQLIEFEKSVLSGSFPL